MNARGGGRGRPAEALGLDLRVCPRCFGNREFLHPPAGQCEERLDKYGAAEILGVSGDTWSRMCREIGPNARQKRQGPLPDYPRTRCADGRARDLWLRSTVEEYAANRPGRGAGGGRPRKDGTRAQAWTAEQRRVYAVARASGSSHAAAARRAAKLS